MMLSLQAFGFRLEPMVADFSPKSEGTSKVFRVENNGQDRIAIQLKMTTRLVDSTGKETREPTQDFTIYPDQISLGPNDARNIRVTYKGPKDIKSERAYRLVASQLPVDFKAVPNQNQLNFLFQYVASVYFKPEGSYPKIEVSKIEIADSKKLKVSLTNTGTAHRLLKDVKVTILNSEGKPIALQESSFKNWAGENLLAGASRDLEIETVDRVAKQAKLKAEVQIQNSAGTGN